ncbi:hypothetical protein EIP91_000435 [Steccherinum ochraceum]|uniref:Protein-S-isoprenylcysteine O-methyltransferase n=1 Tax=Steccherinum ochraceum TaxID=92696 RepID=A0A4R0RFP1_9APHY|nr:hypothetical protein EIP91_000435 [Steccherinum ochraceum]
MSSLSPSLYRIPFVATSLIANIVALTPPNQDADPEERKRYQDTKRKKLEPLTAIQWWILPTLFGYLYFLHLTEIYIILAGAYPALRLPFILNILLPSRTAISSVSDRFHVSPALIVGTSLSFFACQLRLACFRTMGRQFTFELAIKKGHKLITSGPYSVVRHPAYLGSVCQYTGLLINTLGTGSWFEAAGMWSTVFGCVVGGLWVAIVLFTMTSLVKRVPKEDKVLKEEFGKEWIDWSTKTRYKLIPGVY